MKNRIKELRKQILNLTQQQFADDLNLSKSAIESYEYGRNEPPDRVLRDICRIYKVNYDWLLNGNGEIFAPKTRAEEITDFANDLIEADDNDFKRRFIDALLKLNADDWKDLERIANKILKKEKE